VAATEIVDGGSGRDELDPPCPSRRELVAGE
jgi:hypothetical protein